jgi:F0F1-type ATP synthase delta subunit
MLKDSLKKKYGHANIEIEYQVKPELLGGL